MSSGDRIVEIATISGGAMAVLSVAVLMGKGIRAAWRRIRGNCQWAMRDIKQSDPWWTPSDRNPIFSRRR